MQRVFGAMIHESTAPCIVHWAEDPRVDVRMLRRALDDVLAADTLTSPVSEMLKIDYLVSNRELDDPLDSLQFMEMREQYAGLLNRFVSQPARLRLKRFGLRAANDPEKSRRALKILFANWLAQVNRLPGERVAVALEKPTLIYAADPTAPAAANAVEPEELSAAIEHTTLARLFFHHGERDNDDGTLRAPYWSWEGTGALALEQKRRAALILKLAALLHERERGRLPAKAGDLVGTYLKALPPGINGDEPIPEFPTDRKGRESD